MLEWRQPYGVAPPFFPRDSASGRVALDDGRTIRPVPLAILAPDFASGKTRGEIAALLGVAPKTLWRALRECERRA